MGWYGEKRPKELYCYDQAGRERLFYYVVDDHNFASIYDFSVFVIDQPVWPPPSDRRYEISILRNEEGELQTVNMDNHEYPEYKGKGITEAILPEIARRVQEDIVSSPPYRDGANRRSRSATVIWQRLVRSGIAEPEDDHYRLRLSRALAAPLRRSEKG